MRRRSAREQISGRQQLCRLLRRAGFLISAATPRARKLQPRARLTAPQFDAVDCACFVAERLRSVLPKATIGANAWVTIASRVQCGDLSNIVEPSQRMAIARFART